MCILYIHKAVISIKIKKQHNIHMYTLCLYVFAYIYINTYCLWVKKLGGWGTDVVYRFFTIYSFVVFKC